MTALGFRQVDCNGNYPLRQVPGLTPFFVFADSRILLLLRSPRPPPPPQPASSPPDAPLALTAEASAPAGAPRRS